MQSWDLFFWLICQLLAKILAMHIDFERHSFHLRLIQYAPVIVSFACLMKSFSPLFSFVLID